MLVACCMACALLLPLVSESQRSDLNDGESMEKAFIAEKEEGKHFKVVSNWPNSGNT